MKQRTETVHLLNTFYVCVSAVGKWSLLSQPCGKKSRTQGTCCNYAATSLGNTTQLHSTPETDASSFTHRSRHWTCQAPLFRPGCLPPRSELQVIKDTVSPRSGLSVFYWAEPAHWDPCPFARNGKGLSSMGQAYEEGEKLPTTSMLPMAEHKTLCSAKEESLGHVGASCRKQQGYLSPFLSWVQPPEWPTSRSGSSCQGYHCFPFLPADSSWEEEEGRGAICRDGILTSLGDARLQGKHSLPSTSYISVRLSYN